MVLFKKKLKHLDLTEADLQQRMLMGNMRLMEQMREQQQAELEITKKDKERKELLRQLMGD